MGERVTRRTLTAVLVSFVGLGCAPPADGQPDSKPRHAARVDVEVGGALAPLIVSGSPVTAGEAAAKVLPVATVAAAGGAPSAGGAAAASALAVSDGAVAGSEQGLSALSRRLDEVLRELDEIVEQSLQLQRSLLRLRLRGDGNEQPDPPPPAP